MRGRRLKDLLLLYRLGLNADGEVLDADVTWWAYSSSAVEAMPAEVDIAKEIMKTIERLELPS